MTKYKFLTEEWVAAAKELRESAEGDMPAPPHQIRMNLNITEVPEDVDGGSDIKAFMDSSGGSLVMDLGALDDPELTVTVDYATAKAIFVEGNPQAGMQAFMAGKIKVEGDMTKLMVMQSAPAGPEAAQMQQALADMTE